MFLNVQYITIVIVGDGASTSRTMFLYEKDRIKLAFPSGESGGKAAERGLTA